MDVNIVNSDEIQVGIEAQWEEFHDTNQDARMNWNLAWGMVKKTLQKEKKKQVEG